MFNQPAIAQVSTSPVADSVYSTLFSSGFFVGETDEPYFQEKLLQIIWNEQLVVTPLVDAAGRTVSVLCPGTWNVAAGPDFHSAAIAIDGITLRGSVEVHMRPELWHQHGHTNDSRYANTILHVVWRNPAGHQTFPAGVPLLVLENQLSRPVREIMGTFDAASYPYARMVQPRSCAAHLARRSDAQLKDIFRCYGLTRLLRRAERLSIDIETAGLETAAYHGICDGLGYMSNRDAFAALAEAVPLACLRGRSMDNIAAMLFGAAGLLPDLTREAVLPRHRAAVRKMWDVWGAARVSHFSIEWSRSGLRPNNVPERRVMALAALLSAIDARPAAALLKAFDDGNEREILRRLRDVLRPSHDEALATFHTFCRDLRRPAALLGNKRVDDLIVNLVLPLYMAHGLLRGDRDCCELARAIYMIIPRLQDNRQLEEAAHYFFVPPSRAHVAIDSACAQQGLLQVYRDFHQAL
jgi:hypothetical protein